VGANPFRNVWNAPFAAVSDGPQGAIVVEEPAGRLALADAPSRESAVRDAVARQHSARSLAQATQAVRFLRQHDPTKRRAQLRVPRTIVHTAGGRLILPDLDRVRQTGGTIGDPNNKLTFTFEGWSTQDQQALQTYLDAALPVARTIYGPPAFNLTVKIIKDDTLQSLQGGTYDISANEIRMPSLSGNFPEDTFVLILLVLNAFHDDVALFYDSWEQGMIGAAATAVQTTPGVSSSYDPAIGPYYTITVYDPQNQPALGNSTWYPGSGFSGMLVYRMCQARSAWTKCYVEDDQFFRNFNRQYYAKLNASSAAQRKLLPGDTPALLELCQAALLSVEGTPFISWYRQQYVLDTSVTVGPKLFCWNLPVREDATQTDGIILMVAHYETDPTGNETPRSGTAELTYWDYTFTKSLFANEGYEIEIAATGDMAGQGFLFPNFLSVGDPQRITVEMELNGLVGRYPVAHSVRGFVEKPPRSGKWENTHSIYGCVIGPNQGTVSIVGLGNLTGITVNRGVWSAELANNYLSPAPLQVTFDDGDGNVVTRKVNVGYDSYGVMLPGGTRTGLAYNLPYGTNGVYMLSVPLQPLEGDPARALGIPPDQFMLARWKPNAPAGGEYEIYPTIDPPAPGRGYWIRVLSDVTLAVDGLLPPDNDDVRVPINAGWNMIGCARNRNVNTSDLLIQHGADSESLADAVTDGWVQAGIWAYGQQTDYSLVQKLKPFEGYWLRCLLPEGAIVIFPTGSTPAAAKDASTTALASPFGRVAWQTVVRLEFGGARSSVTLGIARSATNGYDTRYDLQAPPAFGGQPVLRFLHGGWGRNAGEYASDFRGFGARGPWRLRVIDLPRGARARLRWPDLSRVPARLQPVLLDRARGRQVLMRSRPGYEFVGTGGPYDLEITLRRDRS